MDVLSANAFIINYSPYVSIDFMLYPHASPTNMHGRRKRPLFVFDKLIDE